MFGLYITHPQVRIDPDTPVPEWSLSDVGAARARQAAGCAWVQSLGRILSSDETKALETAACLAAACRLEVEVLAGTGENDRSATGFLKGEAFENAADWFFSHPEESFCGWERAIDAQARIVCAVDAMLKAHDPAVPLAFVGHGAVGTLLKCHFLNIPIDRRQDQKPGGGQLFAFSLADRKPVCDWTPMETWRGWAP